MHGKMLVLMMAALGGLSNKVRCGAVRLSRMSCRDKKPAASPLAAWSAPRTIGERGTTVKRVALVKTFFPRRYHYTLAAKLLGRKPRNGRCEHGRLLKLVHARY